MGRLDGRIDGWGQEKTIKSMDHLWHCELRCPFVAIRLVKMFHSSPVPSPPPSST